MRTEELKDKKILILGFGKEGRNTLSFLRKNLPEKRVGIADQKKLKIEKANLRLHLGDGYLESIPDYDVIFKAPGVPLRKVKPFLKKGQELTSQDRFFVENCPGTIIGITGTKGKGTTASLVYNILKQEKKGVFLVGNIGEPRLTYLQKAEPEDIFVQEFSARQIQLLEEAPRIVVFLNLYQAHLDYYRSFEEYKKTKSRIIRLQNKKDILVFNKDQKEVKELARSSDARKFGFSLEGKAAACLKQEAIFWKKERIISSKEVPLPGRFNLENVLAAIAVSKTVGVSNASVRKGVKSFKPMPHRLEKVGEYKGVTFYNDSLATLPEPVIFALNTLGDKVETIILGGHEAKQDFKDLVEKIAESKIKNIILFPPTGKGIKKKLREMSAGSFNLLETESMEEAIRFSFENTHKNKVVLLSPAAPSFGVFKNYKERGNLFKKFIKKYGGEKD